MGISINGIKVAGVGIPGTPATVNVGTVSTGEPGSEASVTNAGTESAAVLNFVIPRGSDGVPGKDGGAGPQGSAGQNATINGVSALTLSTTGGLSGTQSDNIYTIDGTGVLTSAKQYTDSVVGNINTLLDQINGEVI